MLESKNSDVVIQSIVYNNGNEQITVKCNYVDESHEEVTQMNTFCILPFKLFQT